MLDDLTTALVSAHRADLAREAGASRLARIVTCCQASQVRLRTSALVHWLRGGQLGSGYVDAPSGPITRRACSC